MKRIFPVLFLILVCAGCETIPNSIVSNAPARPSDRVTPGMNRTMVASIMSAHVVVGYEVDPDTRVAKTVEAQNLYSAELVKVGGVVYQVDRYIVHAGMTGARIAETELFPVVYKDGLVVATGRDGLAALTTSAAPVRAVK